jgi:hypothetical protein
MEDVGKPGDNGGMGHDKLLCLFWVKGFNTGKAKIFRTSPCGPSPADQVRR